MWATTLKFLMRSMAGVGMAGPVARPGRNANADGAAEGSATVKVADYNDVRARIRV